MGVDAEDVDGDGLPELFATHFREDYNTLYRNLDGRNFQDVSARARIVKDSMPDVGWGCALSDLDNDGWPDMLVVTGHVDDNLPLIGQNVTQAERAKVWRNLGDGQFRLVRDPGPFFARDHVARGAAFGDLDNDGDIDVVVSLMDSRPAILLNESPPRAWVRIGPTVWAGRSGRDRRPSRGPRGRAGHPPSAQGGGQLSLCQRPAPIDRTGSGPSGWIELKSPGPTGVSPRCTPPPFVKPTGSGSLRGHPLRNNP